MSWFTRVWSSSIGKKVLVAVTGLALVGFLVGHLLGNLQLFLGADALNMYSKGLHDLGPLLTVAEIGIIAAFIGHVFLVIKLTLENKKARGSSYGQHVSKKPTINYTASRTMAISGLIVLAFLVVHILDYRVNRAMTEAALANCLTLGTECDGTIGAVVAQSLQVPWRAALYTVGSLLIGWHLFHGIQSSARSLGIASRKWTPIIEKVGTIGGLGMGILFAAIPVAVYATAGSFAKVDQLGASVDVAVVEDAVVVVPTTGLEQLDVEVVRTMPAAPLVPAVEAAEAVEGDAAVEAAGEGVEAADAAEATAE